MRKFINEKIRITCEKLDELSKTTVYEIPEMKYISCGYKSGQNLPVVDNGWNTLKRGEGLRKKMDIFGFMLNILLRQLRKIKKLCLNYKQEEKEHGMRIIRK